MSFGADGFAIFESVLTPPEVAALIGDLPANLAGLRNVLRRSPVARTVAHSEAIFSLLRRLGYPAARPVRAIFFDKNPARNWAVPWHQDVAIAVAERIETPGFRAWSLKDGVPHVQPPAELLAGMVTLRFHLDPCDATNGALRVIPGSHRQGFLSEGEISAPRRAAFTCCVPSGGVLAMCPLLLHASSRVAVPTHRRVLHVEYASAPLPNGLRWFEDAPDSKV
jgi:phytanoyl-CoA dioxygenase PhyH